MKKILYVEDEPLVASLVQRKLERKGYAVVLARNAAETEEVLRSALPDLILLDIGFGPTGPDGWEIQEKLRLAPATQHIPVIALTAQSPTREDRKRALELGFVDHIPKPIDFDALYAAIAAALRSVEG